MPEYNYSLPPNSSRQSQKETWHKENVRKLRKSNRNLKKQRNRLKVKVSNMAELTKQDKLDAEAISTIESYFGEAGLNLFKDFKKYPAKRKYSDSIRKFALTLFCYSNKAYLYVRKLLPLPHPRIITKWLSTIDGNSGITKESIDSVEKNTGISISIYFYFDA